MKRKDINLTLSILLWNKIKNTLRQKNLTQRRGDGEAQRKKCGKVFILNSLFASPRLPASALNFSQKFHNLISLQKGKVSAKRLTEKQVVKFPSFLLCAFVPLRLIFVLIFAFISMDIFACEMKYPIDPKVYREESHVLAWNWPWTKDNETPQSPFSLGNVLNLESILNQKIYGQQEAIRTTVNALICYKAGIFQQNQPIASLIYIGPTGVGKTELAKALALEINANLIRLNMSEYANDTALDRLIGLPNGYVDSPLGGRLSNAILEYPNSVVLLDEIEKSHPKVKNLFLHIFDEGEFESGRNVSVDCRGCIFIATSNLAAYQILHLQQSQCSYDEIGMLIEPHLIEGLSPELYNRVEKVVFLGLTKDVLPNIIDMKLKQLSDRIKAVKNITILFGDSVTSFLITYGYSEKLGVRPLQRLIKDVFIVSIAKAIIEGRCKEGDKLVVDCFVDEVLIRKV